MLLFLLACETGKGDPAWDTARDDDREETPVDTDTTGGWVPPDVPCALTDPRPVAGEEVPEFWDLYGPDTLHLLSIEMNFAEYEEDWGCPVGTEDLAASSVTWDGSCAGPEFSWEGVWTLTEWNDGDAGVLRHDGVGVQFMDDYSTGHTVVFDGASYIEADDGVAIIDRDHTFSLYGYGIPEVEGDWIIQSYERWVTDASVTLEGHFDVADSEVSPPGDYCLVSEGYRYADCGQEPWGGWVLVGDATLVVAFDPQVACDGCGAVTIDGVPAGEVCGWEYGAHVP